jgi:hypothetical protein
MTDGLRRYVLLLGLAKKGGLLILGGDYFFIVSCVA